MSFPVRSRRSFALLAGCLLVSVSAFAFAPRAPRTWSFAHDNILGTSLDLTFVAPAQASAKLAESTALAEIERVRSIISTWDATSEASRLITSGSIAHASPELLSVLRMYDQWHAASGGAYSARIGELTDLWKRAEKSGTAPSDAELARVVASLSAPAWRIDGDAVTALTTHPLDLNSLGKGYIINRAIAAVQARVPEVRGGIINIGGDIGTFGVSTQSDGAWRVAVANPLAPADNAAPLAALRIRNRAVSSSGNYARGFLIDGVHYSHIIDPRDGHPADGNPGVTVIAADNATANALATTLSILSPDDGLRLAQSVGAEAMIIDHKGARLTTPNFATYEIPGAPSAHNTSRPLASPRAITAVMDVDLAMESFNRHRPYVAAWITDKAGKHVRTLAMWGNRPKYQRELTRWYSLAGSDFTLIDAVTRATRSAGKYSLEWDGMDQDGKAVANGSYTFWLEAAYENGPHSYKSVTLDCSKSANGSIEKTTAFAGAQVRCASEK